MAMLYKVDARITYSNSGAYANVTNILLIATSLYLNLHTFTSSNNHHGSRVSPVQRRGNVALCQSTRFLR